MAQIKKGTQGTILIIFGDNTRLVITQPDWVENIEKILLYPEKLKKLEETVEQFNTILTESIAEAHSNEDDTNENLLN